VKGLHGLWQVMARELTERARSRAYLLATGITLVAVLGLIMVPSLFGSDTDESTVGSVGEGNDRIIATAVSLGNAGDEPGEPPSIAIDTIAFDDRETAVGALESGEVDAVLVDGEEIIVASAAGFGGASLTGGLQRAAAAAELETVIQEQGQQAANIIQLLTSDPLELTTLDEGDPEEAISRTIVAYFGLLLLYIAVLMYGTWILTGVTEEKSSRVVEVLLSSIRPWQILGGKIIGIGALGVLQLLATLTVAYFALRATQVLDLPPIEPIALVNILVWFVIGFTIYAVLLAATGSLVSRMEDANSVSMPINIVAIAAFFFSFGALNDPTGTVALVGTFIPFTIPFVVPVRAALEAIPAWQYALAVVISLATIALLTYLAGRIYAGGLLRYGGRVRLGEAWRSAGENRG
jgi:ABC-2 type transport system permease protein